MALSAVFLDKDGTLVEDVPYNVDPAQLRFCAGVIEGLQRLQAAHYALILITNQAGIAHGYFSEAALLTLATAFQTELSNRGIALQGFYYCPHHPSGVVVPYAIACTCRKPQPGLLLTAAAEQGIDLGQSWFIGDILNDTEAGLSAGCRTILIDNGNETEWILSRDRLPHHRVPTFADAVQVILAIDSLRQRSMG